MLSVKSLTRIACASAILGTSSLCWAGGHGFAGGHAGVAIVFHGGGHAGARFSGAGVSHGWGGAHFARQSFPGFARFGSFERPVIYGARFGHINTARLGWPGRFGGTFRTEGSVWPRLGYGRRGFATYALGPRRFGWHRRFLRGYAGPAFYPYWNGWGSGYGFASGDVYGFAEPPLAASYSEPPLGAEPLWRQ